MKLAEAVLREVVDFKVEEDRFQVSQPSSIMSKVMPKDQPVNLTHAKFVSYTKLHVIIPMSACFLWTQTKCASHAVPFSIHLCGVLSQQC